MSGPLWCPIGTCWRCDRLRRIEAETHCPNKLTGADRISWLIACLVYIGLVVVGGLAVREKDFAQATFWIVVAGLTRYGRESKP